MDNYDISDFLKNGLRRIGYNQDHNQIQLDNWCIWDELLGKLRNFLADKWGKMGLRLYHMSYKQFRWDK